MIALLTVLLVVLILKLNIPVVIVGTFVKELAIATQERYVSEYSKIRCIDESKAVFIAYMELISPCNGLMDPFNYRDFKSSICKAIYSTDKKHRAELCFIHDLMMEEYHKLIPNSKYEYKVGINEFYNLFRTHL